MKQKHHVWDARSPRKQREWKTSELKTLLSYHETGVTADVIAKILDRSVVSISKKACAQGVRLGQLGGAR